MREWLRTREPAPPAALLQRLEDALESSRDDAPSDRVEHLIRACERTLGDVLARADAGRESALDLLTADALATYAFEAAAEDPGRLPVRAREAMRRISRLGGTGVTGP